MFVCIYLLIYVSLLVFLLLSVKREMPAPCSSFTPLNVNGVRDLATLTNTKSKLNKIKGHYKSYPLRRTHQTYRIPNGLATILTGLQSLDSLEIGKNRAVYLSVSRLVTWHCLRRSLRQALIRGLCVPFVSAH